MSRQFSEDKLKRIAKGSDAWVSALKPYIETRIAELHLELETPGSDPEGPRGGIAELRRLANKIDPDLPVAGEASYFPQRADVQPS